MAKFRVYGVVTGSKYLGEVEASNKEEAEEKAWKELEPSVHLCHQCSGEIEDPEIEDLEIVEEST